MKIWTYVALLGLFTFSTTTFAQGDPAAGQKKSMVCAACHGTDGIAVIPGYPNLKGQNEQYLISSLNAYKNKQRSGGMSTVMQAQATLLSEQDIKNLAAYYANMK